MARLSKQSLLMRHIRRVSPLLTTSLLLTLTACEKPASDSDATTAPASGYHGSVIKGVLDASALEDLSDDGVQLFVAESLSQQIQNDLFETSEITRRMLAEPTPEETSDATATEPQDTETAPDDAARVVLHEKYLALPETLDVTLPTGETVRSEEALVKKYRDLFGKIRPRHALEDVQKMLEWVREHSTELQQIADQKVHHSDTIDFMGIQDEEFISGKHDDDKIDANTIRQAQANLQWLAHLERHLAGTTRALSRELGSDTPSGKAQSTAFGDKRREQMPPYEAWEDFQQSRGIALERAFREYKREKPDAEGHFIVEGSGYVIVEVFIDGEPAYFAEGVNKSPVKIRRLR